MSPGAKANRAKIRQNSIRRIRKKLAAAVSLNNLTSTAWIFLKHSFTPLTESLMEHSNIESADSSSAFSSDLKNWLLYCTRAQISKRQALWDSLHFILNCDLGIVTDTCWIRCLAEDGDVETNSGPVNFSMDDVCDCKDTSAYLSVDLSDAGSAINVIHSKTVDQREEGEMPGREVDTILHQRWAVHDRDRVRTTNTHLPIF